jgi:TetR/AcrR family fatty acid metabolism transcriptional regulator
MSVPESSSTQTPSASCSAPARSREATRTRLLEAGTELFAREGLHAVTTARIAREAGVATGTFYLHFKHKKALFREIVFEALAQLRERQQRSREAAGDALGAQLRASTTELIAFAGENRSLISVLFGADHEGAELGEDVLGVILPDVEAGLRERATAGLLPSRLHPAVAAQALLGQASRVIAWWVEDPARASQEEIVDTLLQMHPARPEG